MKLTINNFRCVKDLSFDVDKITLIGGNNGSGKTTVLQGAGIVASRPVKPLGLNKKDLHLLVRHGCSKGSVMLSTDSGQAEFTLPGGEIATKGKPIEVPTIIAGIEAYSDLSKNDRLTNLTEIMNAFPSREDLEEALGEDVDRDLVTKIWGVIESDGWDYAHKQAKEKGTKLKGAWEHITNERYGSQKAKSWEPPEVDTNLSEDKIQKRIKEFREQESILLELERKGATVKGIDKEIEEKEKRFRELADKKEGILIKLREIPDFDGAVGIECPHCGKAVQTKRDGPVVKLVKAKGTASQKDIDKAAKENKKLNEELRDIEATIDKEKVNPAPLKELKKSIDKLDINFDSAEEARESITELEGNLKAMEAAKEAGKIAKQIEANKEIVDALAPTGVRKNVLNRAIDQFNRVLAKVTEVAGWEGIETDYDMDLYYAGHPITVFDRYSSIRWRINVSIQVALAALSKAPLVLIDAADILDKQGRNGLFRIMARKVNQIAFIVTMTANEREDLPNLTDKGLGKTLWLENGS